jgi:uncharacterized protein (AIM24 family)
LEDGLRIEDTCNVTIEPGVVILMGSGENIIVEENSHLIAEGTVTNRITITGLTQDTTGYWG